MYVTKKSLILVAVFATLPLLSVGAVQAADHLDAPAINGMGDLDVNDLYAFQSPTDSSSTVLIMTVNPFAGVVSGTTFNTVADYEIHVDNDGDAVADLSYKATFSDNGVGGQSVDLALNGSSIASGPSNSTLTIGTGGKVETGVFDDPFFFDLAGFQNGLMFTGDDTLAGANVSAIVLEVPSAGLGGPNIGVWATTTVGGAQVDRIGRPAINTVLIPSARKDEFNGAMPSNDPTGFGADVQASIESLNGGDVTLAATLTGILLPDVLTIDVSDASGFLNGRGLADDVIDAELTLLTNSQTPIGDGVDANDVVFPGVFPYLAPANIPEPSGWAGGVFAVSLLLSVKRRRVGASGGCVANSCLPVVTATK